eukprot:30612-Pelagococcus_subviridis.AAC.10
MDERTKLLPRCLGSAARSFTPPPPRVDRSSPPPPRRRRLAVAPHVQPFALLRALRHSELAPADRGRDLQAHERRHRGVRRGRDRRRALNHRLRHRRGLDVEPSERGRRRDPEEARPHEPADAVDAEHVERVVVSVLLLQHERKVPAHDPRDQPEKQRAERPDEPGARRHRREPRDASGGDAEHRRFAVLRDVLRAPRHRRGRGGDLRREARERGVGARGERAAAVEPVPPDPQHAGAEHGEDQVPGDHLILFPRAERHRADERADPGGDVHDDPAREV